MTPSAREMRAIKFSQGCHSALGHLSYTNCHKEQMESDVKIRKMLEWEIGVEVGDRAEGMIPHYMMVMSPDPCGTGKNVKRSYYWQNLP